MIQRTETSYAMPPQVTCIIPVYNGQEYLERAVLSVLNQNNVNVEVLLIDDCSPQQQARDCAMELARRDSRVRTLFLPENGGQSQARNLGIVLARAPFIMFLDQDDEHIQDWYWLAVQFLEQNPKVAAISGRALTVDLPERLGVQDDDLRVIGLSGVFMTNMLLRRSVALTSGGFPMTEQWRNLAAGEDGHYRSLLVHHWNVLGCDQPALIHHAREGGATVYFLDRSRVEDGRVLIEADASEKSGLLQQAADQYTQWVNTCMEEVRQCLKLGVAPG